VSLGNLGIYYFSLGNYTKAIDYHQQSLTIAREVKDRESEASDLNNLGLSLYKFGNFSSAEKTLIEGIQVYESLRAGLGANDANKISIFEKQVSTYKILQQVLIAQNKPDTALEIAERGRARALVELLATRLSPDQTQPANIAPPTIEQIQQIAKAQKSTLVQYSIIYDEFKIQDKDQWRESELYIWVVKPTGEVTFRKTDLKPLWQQQDTSLEQLVFSTRDSMGVRGRALAAVRPRPGKERLLQLSETERLQQLHKLLIDPIADLLPNDPNAHVTFLPQRALFLVPFPALQDAAGKYLIEKHTILTAPSIQVLGLTLEQRAKVKQANPQGAIVVGNPTMPSVKPDFDKSPVQLPALPGAEKEALAIAPLLNTQALTGNQATKSAVLQLMPQARFIHLATHGLLDDIRGLGSSIALAPSGNDSGLLTAEEILDLKLNAELVVLSACDTGRGKITGDGVVGLSRALITAGVPSVLVSLWSVDDQSTEELMTEFYQRIQQQPDKAQGLRQAMLMTMKKHPQPKYWAAFTLIGESQ
jgi:CHAT domain-containing protein